MSAKKKTGDDTAAGTNPGGALVARWVVIAAVILAAGGGVCYAVWRQVREHVMSSNEYLVDPEKIVVTPPPPWIRTDVTAEVIRDASFDGPLSLLDPELTVRMASAFAAHPWVAHVERVSKHFPSRVEVVLDYRQPVAMVEVKGGALPVDVEGVVLPSGDFTQEQAESYPRIDEIHTAPTGAVGSKWADTAVAGAARIAAVLGHDWQALGLYRIVPAGRKPARTGFEYEYAIYTKAGTRIDWGRAPSSEPSPEPPASDKIARLVEYATAKGSLDNTDGAQRLRFLETGQLEAQKRAPVKALPPGR